MKIYTLLKIDEQGREKVLMVSEDMNKVFSKINYYKEALYLQTWNSGKKGSQYLIKKYNEEQELNKEVDAPIVYEDVSADDESQVRPYIFNMDDDCIDDEDNW